MDGLALLCNLFADGPVTLKRLRIAGVANLVELERAAPARLAEWLHASLPQAQAFAEEAGKLARRLSEGAAARAGDVAPSVRSIPAEEDRSLRGASPRRAVPAVAQPLRAGLLPGLDEALCGRLALHQVHTVQALREFSGLALARRTGIPYSTLLELARHARRIGLERAPQPLALGRTPPAEAPTAPSRPGELRSVELVPFDARPRRAHEPELARSDEFTLPMVEPEAAGPFG